MKLKLLFTGVVTSVILTGCGAAKTTHTNDSQTLAMQDQTSQVVNQYKLQGNQQTDYSNLYHQIEKQGQQAAQQLKKHPNQNQYQNAVKIATLLIIGNHNNNQLASSTPLPDQKQLLYQQLTNPKKYGTDLVTVDTTGLGGNQKVATEIMDNYDQINNPTIQNLNQYISNNFFAFMEANGKLKH